MRYGKIFLRNFLLIILGCWICGIGLEIHSSAGELDFAAYRQKALAEIKKLQEAMQKDPTDARAHFQLGLAYMALGRHSKEIASYKEAVRLKPDYAEPHGNLGIAYDKLGDGENAIRHTKEARRLFMLQRNHRKIRETQRRLRRFSEKYGIN